MAQVQYKSPFDIMAKVPKNADLSVMLALSDDFRTIDWVTEFPFPTIALKELAELLSTQY